MDRPRPWLRYVDASDLDNSTIKFDGMNVDSTAGEKLGDVDGVVVDVSSGRPYYVVVDAGGWFRSKYFLLPIGHVAMSASQDRLTADVDKSRVERYPGFDRGEFEKLSDNELERMAGQIADACCPTTIAATTVWTASAHYTSPDWWKSDYYRGAGSGVPSSSLRSTPAVSPAPAASNEAAQRDRDAVMAHAGDVSPHSGGRAQPGDVLGIETGGEETHIGDTTKDENERRRDAERAAAKRARG